MGNLFSRRTRQRTALAAESNEDKWGVIYDVWKSKKTNDFSKNLKLYLSKKGYKMSAIIHESGNKPIIALCLLYSRLGADVEYTVANLSSEQRNRTILILLNYRKEVTKTRIHDDQFENQYPGMTVHNCFLQKDNHNVEEVKKDIWQDLERRETHNKLKRKFFKSVPKQDKSVPKQEEVQALPEATVPWRPYKDLQNEWTENYYEDLLEQIGKKSAIVLSKSGVSSDTVNIMLLGYVQSGKSSTINSFYSILDGEICKRAKSGGSSTSFTQKYTSYMLENKLEKVVLYDTMGIELGPNQGVLVQDIKSCIDGKITHNYKFNPCDEHKYTSNKDDLERKEIHCVMYCVDAESVNEDIVPSFEKKMQDVETELKVASQDRVVLVTKIDEVCPETKEDIRKIFHSTKVKTVVEKAASVFRVSINQVFPIMNYTKEVETDNFINIPLLLALKKAVDFGTDYLRQKLGEKNMVNKEKNMVNKEKNKEKNMVNKENNQE